MQNPSQPRQANRSLRNPYTKKSKSSRLRLLSILIFTSLILISIFYLLVSQAFLKTSQSASASASDHVSDLVGGNTNISNSSRDDAPVIAYAISLTSCKETPSLIDGAAVLKHSIHLSSIRNENENGNGNDKSKYDYQMYAIIHQGAKSCQTTLEKLGYKTMLVDVPVPLEDIRGEFLRERVHNNGCCGELEFIKLWSYTLTDYPLVVHLDLDTVILKPMDELFDAALSGTTDHMEKSVMWETELHKGKGEGSVISAGSKGEGGGEGENDKPINAFFTRDYNMVRAGKKPAGVQGGFLVLRPSHEVFREFQEIIREGNYRKGSGWGGLGYAFYGAMTFQGIIPYYYDAIHPGTAVELNRCVYNQMADNPRDKKTVNNVVSGKCRDGRDDCEDCRERGVEEVVTAHFTLCQKPWSCLLHKQDMLQHRLCRKISGEWYRIRADWELSRLDRSLVKEEQSSGSKVVVGEGKTDPEHFRGFCKSSGDRGYLPIKLD